jgi:BirA family biotin operon repressor/biotin-[acetyl-CoA-carboxylase] ligase
MGDLTASPVPSHPSSRAPGGPVVGWDWQIRRFAEIDSTNRWLLAEARSGAAPGVVAVADHQTQGRGRLGRSWSAPPGSSLLVSVLLRPVVRPEEVHRLTAAASLALAEAVEASSGVRADLKWPNDLVVGDRKLAGLLTEVEVSAGGRSGGPVDAVVIGAGCNLNWDAVPEELLGLATACNLESGRRVERDDVLDRFLERLRARLDVLETDPRAVLREYRERLATIGRHVAIELPAGRLVGVATSVDDHGHLVVTPAGGAPVTVSAGDVVHLRPA